VFGEDMIYTDRFGDLEKLNLLSGLALGLSQFLLLPQLPQKQCSILK